jgi:hypothetical protein
MAYIIQANDPRGLGQFFTAADRKEALAVAVTWASGGCTGIKIVGDGRIYTPEELASVIINDDAK